MEFGGWGRAPAKEDIQVVSFGPREFGWTVKAADGGMGHFYAYDVVFAPTDGAVKQMGMFPTHYDNNGNCEDGKDINTKGPCRL